MEKTDNKSVTGTDRRQLLYLVMATGVAGCAPLQRLAPLPDALQPANYVDTHCHIFNGADIPIEGFIKHVIAPDNKIVSFLDALRLIRLVTAIIQGQAAGVAAENTRIDDFVNGGRVSLSLPFSEAEAIKRGLLSILPQAGLAASVEPYQNYFRYRLSIPPGNSPDAAARAADAALADTTSANTDALLLVYRLFGDEKTAARLEEMEASIEARRPGGASQLDFYMSRYATAVSSALQAIQQSFPEIQAKIDETRVPERAKGFLGGVFESINKLRFVVAYSLRWAAGYTKCRVDLADQLRKHYPDQRPQAVKPQARLYCHALLDYDCWVDPHVGSPDAQTKVSLEDQMVLAGRIARLSLSGSRFHGLFPFDPLRAVLVSAGKKQFGKHPRKLLQEAIEEHGFIGAKIYPPMGFAPYGNAAAEFAGNFGPQAELLKQRHLGPDFDLGKALDEELLEFYAYCAENHIPVLTHTSGSQFTFPDAWKRIDPKYWKHLLDNVRTSRGRTLRDLRLNLGHLGGLWCLGKATKGDLSGVVCVPLTAEQTADVFDGSPELLNETWASEIIGMLANDASGSRPYPNLYTDFADLSSVSNPFERDQRKMVISNWAKVIRARGVSALDRILYGTDWTLLGRDVDFEDYYRGAIPALDELGEKIGLADRTSLIENVMWGNAVAFLGLGAGGVTRGRLDKFYAANHISAPELAALDMPLAPVVGPR